MSFFEVTTNGGFAAYDLKVIREESTKSNISCEEKKEKKIISVKLSTYACQQSRILETYTLHRAHSNARIGSPHSSPLPKNYITSIDQTLRPFL